MNPYFCTPKNSSYTSESSSFGRARPCQGRGGRFEPGLSLQNPEFRFGIFFKSLNRRPGGGTGRHAGLRHCSLDEQNLSALREIEDVELRKFGEPFKLGIPSEARKGTCRD